VGIACEPSWATSAHQCRVQGFGARSFTCRWRPAGKDESLGREAGYAV